MSSFVHTSADDLWREAHTDTAPDCKPVQIAPFGWLSRHHGGSDASYRADLAEAGWGLKFINAGKRVVTV